MKAVLAYAERDMKRWIRAPIFVASNLVLPAAWLIFMGVVLPIKKGNYLDFILPGILVMTVLNAGLSGGSSLMFDKTLGYLNKFLAVPSPRESILLGKILFITIKGLTQSLIILGIGILIGATVQSLLTYVATFAILFLFGVFIASFGATIAIHLDNYDSYSAAQAFISMPLYLASTALISFEDMPKALYYIAKVNPLSYAIDSIREAAAGAMPLLSIAVLALLVIIIMPLCVWMFRKATVS